MEDPLEARLAEYFDDRKRDRRQAQEEADSLTPEDQADKQWAMSLLPDVKELTRVRKRRFKIRVQQMLDEELQASQPWEEAPSHLSGSQPSIAAHQSFVRITPSEGVPSHGPGSSCSIGISDSGSISLPDPDSMEYRHL